MAGKKAMTVLGVAAVGLMWNTLVWAHARLIKGEPAPGASVSSPAHIRLRFSEAIAVRFSSIRLVDAAGRPVATMRIPAPNADSLAVAPTSPLTAGIYTLTWTAVSTDDGHRTSGSYRFTVR